MCCDTGRALVPMLELLELTRVGASPLLGSHIKCVQLCWIDGSFIRFGTNF